MSVSFLRSLVSLRVKILLPLVVICLGATYGVYHSIEQMFREQKQKAYIENARALLLSAESAREYAATQFNKNLFRHDISKKEDLLYTVPVFAAMQVAKLKAKELGMEIKVPKFQPRNPDNEPDMLEATVLHKLESGGLAEHVEIDTASDKLRYFRPVKLTKECLNCHGDPANSMALWGNDKGFDATGTRMENWKEGEVHGAFEVLMPLAPVRAEADAGARKIATMLLYLVGAVIVVGFLIARLVMGPIKKLMRANAALSGGDLSTRVSIRSRDELGVLGESFNSMVDNIAKQHRHIEEHNARLSHSVNSVLSGMDSFAHGDFSTRLDVDSQDEIGRLKSGFNTMITTVQESHERDEAQRIYLSNAVSTMLVAMKRFSEGDLTVRLEVQSDDEIGQLMRGFNESMQRLTMIVENVMRAVDATASASAQISSSTEEMAAGSREQSMQTTDVASAVEEMTKTIIENSDNARSTADMAESARSTAEQGAEVVTQTVDGMRRMASVVQSSAETVSALGRSSKQIGEIVSVINDIADQTNLLALNAAIEAARAGEQGRGFAVVADEVRKLAERTSTATREISDMIGSIQRETSSAVVAMEEGTREVSTSINLADRAGQSFSEISHAVHNVSSMVSHIAVACEQQSSASETISRSIQSISAVTSESSTGIDQIAQAAEDLNRLTENLHQLMSSFTIAEQDNATRPIPQHKRDEDRHLVSRSGSQSYTTPSRHMR